MLDEEFTPSGTGSTVANSPHCVLREGSGSRLNVMYVVDANELNVIADDVHEPKVLLPE
jgi:hypothetical protein